MDRPQSYDVTSNAEDAETDTGPGVLAGAAEVAGDVAGTIANSVRDGLGEAAASVGNMADGLASRARNATAASVNVLEREPLAIAALGLMIGTAIGVLLPRTAVEDEQLGALSGKVRDKAEALWDQGVAEVKNVAADAYQAVKGEADRQGLGTGESPITDQLGKIVKSATTTVEGAVRERLGGATKN